MRAFCRPTATNKVRNFICMSTHALSHAVRVNLCGHKCSVELAAGQTTWIWIEVDLDPEGELGPCVLRMPGFPADRTQQNQPDNATRDRSRKDKAAALRERERES